MSTIHRPLVLATCMFSGVAAAQTFEPPKFYAWHNPPFTAAGSTWDWTDSKFNRMIFINATERYTKPDGNVGYREVTPTAAANATANAILAGRYPTGGAPQTVFPGRIAVMINNYGRDASDHDYIMTPEGRIARDANDSPIENISNYRTRFFYPEDRLDGIGDFQFGFPIEPGSDADYGTGRSYRHPFIKNTLGTSTSGVFDSPLKQWTKEYADALWTIWDTRQNGGQPLPNPTTYTFVFDCEAELTGPNSRNGIHMIRELALRSAKWNAALPGAGGASLASLYNAGITDYGFAANSGITPGIARDLVGVNTSIPAYSGSLNRKYMTWVYERWQHVRDAVMENCAYSTLRAKFPGCRVGNYDDYNVDGAAVPATSPGDAFRVGWMEQRPFATDPNYNLDPPATLAPAWTTTQFFPRLSIHAGAGGPLWREGVNGNLWYIGMRRKSSGDHESPPLYGMQPAELDWYDGAGGVPGHRQPDYYAPGHPMEYDDWKASLRFHRRTAEAIINSCITPGTDCGERQAKFVPWLEVVGSETGNYPAGTRGANETRDLLAMLRGKNLAEGYFFSNWYINGDGSVNQGNLETAWLNTKRAIDDVYAFRVIDYARLSEIAPQGGWPDDSDPNRTTRLEFTLLSGGQPRTVHVLSKAGAGGGQPHRTELRVDFNLHNASAEPVDGLLQINVECWATSASATGYVQVGKLQPNGQWSWDYANSEHGEWSSSVPCYRFHAPADPGEAVYRNRRTLTLPFQSEYIWNDGGQKKVRLRLIHRNASAFSSTYDLVQLYRVLPPSTVTTGVAALMSDTNSDGIVDASDAVEFMQEWLDGTEAANTNVDSLVDFEDLQNFEEAFASGT